VLYAVGVLQKGDEKTVYCSLKQHDVATSAAKADHNEQISRSFTECEQMVHDTRDRLVKKRQALLALMEHQLSY
jgi:hypothetical protein